MEPRFEGSESRASDGGNEWCSGCSRCSMLFIELPLVFHLSLVSCRPAVLDVTSHIEIGVDELMGVTRGLIDLLIGIAVAALAS